MNRGDRQVSNGLTADFDLSAQIAEKTVDRIFGVAYWLGAFGNLIAEDLATYGMRGHADILILPPSLNFDTGKTELTNPIRLIFPLAASIEGTGDSDGPATAIFSFISSIELEHYYGTGEKFVKVDFTGLSTQDVQIAIKQMTISEEDKEGLEEILRAVVTAWLQNQTQELVLSPAISSSPGEGPEIEYIAVKVHDDHSWFGGRDCLNLLMSSKDWVPTPEEIVPFIRRGQDFALAIPSDMIDDRIEKEIAHLRGKEIDDDLVLNRLRASLSDGYILVRGRVTKRIDCWFDAVIDFSGKVKLRIDDRGKLEIYTDDVKVDLPWWLDLTMLISVYICHAIRSAIENSIKGRIDPIAGAVFSDFSVFTETIPDTVGRMERTPRFRVKNRDVEIREEGIIISGDALISGIQQCIGPNLSIESYSYHDYFARHRYYRGEITRINSVLDKEDATFRIVPGLADGGYTLVSDSRYVSFESLNCPGHYLRHRHYKIRLDPHSYDRLYREDATFRIVPGLADNTWFSFESYNYPGYYIRCRNYRLNIEKGNNNRFKTDATFDLVSPLTVAESGATARIRGKVLRRSYLEPESKAEPWSNAPVQITSRTSGLLAEVTTDESGRYEADNIPLGTSISLYAWDDVGPDTCRGEKRNIYTGLNPGNYIEIEDIIAVCFPP